MNNAKQEYAQQVKGCNFELLLDGSTTPLQLAMDYAEVGEDCGLNLDEAVEIIERELAQYVADKADAKIKIAESLEALNETAKEQARKLLGKYKWTPPQRRRLEQQAERGFIIAFHVEIAEVFGRMMPNNPYEIATYRIGWLGSKIPAKKRLNFTC